MREAARLLGVHENTIRNWVSEGMLTDTRVPGSRYLRVAASEVAQLAARRRKPVDRYDLPEWEALCGEAARLGVALARFDRALKAYKKARDRIT